MIAAIRWAREKNVPFLGICLGFQVACIEWARNVCGQTSESKRGGSGIRKGHLELTVIISLVDVQTPNPPNWCQTPRTQ